MFNYIWRFYRWYDNLRLRGLGNIRFLIFIMPFSLAIITISLWANGYVSIPALLSVLFIGFSFVTRVYWVDYKSLHYPRES